METDHAAFDCETCPVACQQATLDTANTEAWGLYRRLHNRFALDMHVMADLFRALVSGWPPEDIVDALERMDVMHGVFHPPSREDR